MSNELYHYGVLGMRWGVRRYQNADGSLTQKGEKRFSKVASSHFMAKKDTAIAKMILENQRRKMSTQSMINEKRMNKYSKRANIADKKENAAKANKYKKKRDAYEARLKESTAVEKMKRQKIADIDAGMIKAGRDFIVQTDYNAIPFYIYNGGHYSGVIVSREHRIIERSKEA